MSPRALLRVRYPSSTGASDVAWRELDALGARYREIVDEGYGVPLETRTREQIGIANEIVERAYPYLHLLARRMLNIGPQLVFRKLPLLRAYGAITTADDLAQEGAVELIARLHAYRPGHAMSTFIAWQFCHVPRSREFELLHVPVYQRPELSGKPADEQEVPHLGAMLAYALHGEYQRIGTVAQEAGLPEWSDAAQEHAASFAYGPDELESRIDASRKAERLLRTVPPRTRRILELRYGLRDGVERTLQEVGRLVGLTKQRIQQVEHDAVASLRERGTDRRERSGA